MGKVIEHKKLTETLGITECADGFWLYDKTRGMNLAMKEKTAQDAFVKALSYYQERLKVVEAERDTHAKTLGAIAAMFPAETDGWSGFN